MGVDYYARFIPNCSTINATLYRLCRKDVPWTLTDIEAQAVETAKRVIGSVGVLVHYDPKKQLAMNCDASQYGVGAVLSPKSMVGTEQPIAFVSRSLSAAQQNYSQLDKGSLEMVFEVGKLNKFLYGQDF